MVCAEPKGLMQGIGKVCPCVCRHIPELFTGTRHHHVTQGADHLVTCVFTAEFLFKYPEYKERYVTGEEVRPYAVLPLQEYRACLEFCLHYAEAFLCFPAFPVDVYYLMNTHVRKVRAYGIEPVIHFLPVYCVRIKERDVPGTYLTCLCHCLMAYETVRGHSGSCICRCLVYLSLPPDKSMHKFAIPCVYGIMTTGYPGKKIP